MSKKIKQEPAAEEAAAREMLWRAGCLACRWPAGTAGRRGLGRVASLWDDMAALSSRAC